MQRVFRQDVRFKDENGKDFSEWREIRVGDFFKERNEFAPKDGRYEHVSLTIEGVVPKGTRYERDFLVANGITKKYKVTRLNDIVYNPANLKFGVIARNKFKDGIFSPIYITYEVIGANFEYIELLVTSHDFIQRARRYEEGTVYERMAVKPSDLARLIVELPSVEDQRKIANFVKALDNRIANQQKSTNQAKSLRKSLLQQMFI
jgi:type I restriction enzyme S subunit